MASVSDRKLTPHVIILLRILVCPIVLAGAAVVILLVAVTIIIIDSPGAKNHTAVSVALATRTAV